MEEDIKKVSSWSKKGTQLLRKKTWYIISILTLSIEPVPMRQLLRLIGYKNEKSFRDNYLRPLRQTGLISMTLPESQNDPSNKYIITDAGKTFLTGS
jgi:predicted transcriptional regulator